MPMLAAARRRAPRLVALIAATVALGIAGAPAHAIAGAPLAALPLAAAPEMDDEGGTASLREQLDAASKGFLTAQAALENSTKRQKQLTERLKAMTAELDAHAGTIGELADVAYRTGRLGPIAALLGSDSPGGFLERATALTQMASNEDRQVRELVNAQQQETRAKAALDAEMGEQRKQIEIMRKRKQQAEQALAANGGGGAAAGLSATNSASAKAAPRNADGSWPSESCSVNDPTTDGCITPRTLHAMNEAKAAGFTHFVSCHRDGGSGEHPKGRACDFAAAKGGFEGIASGADKTYGNNLAAYFIKNANRLGVLYVIWFKQIWLPSSGWKAYDGGNGDPSSDHTNHVHLSVI